MPDILENMLIGGIAGVMSRTMTAPLELKKIQQQNRFMPNSTLMEVIQKEGVGGLWKGNFVNCIRIFPQMAINYAVYQKTNHTIHTFNYFGNNKEIINFLSGTVSGLVSMTIVYPMETIRTRFSLQTNKNHYNGFRDIIQKTSINELYNGLRMSLIGFAPYNAFNFMFYDMNKRLCIRFKDTNPFLYKTLTGGMAGTMAVTLTYPTDLIRRRLQLQGGFDTNVPKYNGIMDCMKTIYRQEGIQGFYRGLVPCYIKIFPAVALQFWFIETLSKYRKTE